MPTVLSITKPFTTIPSKILPTSQHHHHVQSLILAPIKSSSSSSNSTSNDDENASLPARPAITPPETGEIRFRRGSRRRRKEQEDGGGGGGGGGGSGMSMNTQAAPPKDWESMTLTEKAIELYMGEKGLLFWLNKFAYASIFIIIGGWILFRFVGPALNLYQLDSSPLSPTSMFKG